MRLSGDKVLLNTEGQAQKARPAHDQSHSAIGITYHHHQIMNVK